MVRLPLGNSDFQKLRQNGSVYIDKTALLAQLLDSGSEVTLFCRPRRFGKTLSLSMLRYFLEKTEEDRSELYADLVVWQDANARAHFQRHPVIWLSFKDIKGTTWKEAWAQIQHVLREECMRLEWLEMSDRLSARERRNFARFLDGKAEPMDWQGLLKTLSGWLKTATGQSVVVLIDEYDTPIHSAWVHGYYDAAINFFRTFLGTGLKDNPHLYKAVLTGILRVAKEGIFSGLNNLRVLSVLESPFAEGFGFTEAEVAWLRDQVPNAPPLETLRDWYNGYRIGEQTVYNPWSILACLENGGVPAPYWVNTGSIDTLGEQIWQGNPSFLTDLEALLRGETVTETLPETTPLPGMGIAELRSLLVHAGYLTTRRVERLRKGWSAELVIPNRDVHAALAGIIERWLSRAIPDASTLKALLAAMLEGRTDRFAVLLSNMVVRVLSFHDLQEPDPEKVFHAFVLGLLVLLEESHRVVSNREAGTGRADALVIPRQPGGVGVVLEFKKVEHPKEIDAALDAALQQIADRGYAGALTDAGASVIRRYAVVFSGKSVGVRGG